MSNTEQQPITQVTIEEFSDFLIRKNISTKCIRCDSKSLQISVQEPEPGKRFMRVVHSPIVDMENNVFPFYMRICSNCSSVEYYGAVLTYEDIQAQRERNKATADEVRDAK